MQRILGLIPFAKFKMNERSPGIGAQLRDLLSPENVIAELHQNPFLMAVNGEKTIAVIEHDRRTVTREMVSEYHPPLTRGLHHIVLAALDINAVIHMRALALLEIRNDPALKRPPIIGVFSAGSLRGDNIFHPVSAGDKKQLVLFDRSRAGNMIGRDDILDGNLVGLADTPKRLAFIDLMVDTLALNLFDRRRLKRFGRFTGRGAAGKPRAKQNNDDPLKESFFP